MMEEPAVEELKRAVARIEDFEQTVINDMRTDVKALTKSVSELSLNISKQTQMLDAHKRLYDNDMRTFARTIDENKVQVALNRKDIIELNKHIAVMQGVLLWMKWILPIIGMLLIGAVSVTAGFISKYGL